MGFSFRMVHGFNYNVRFYNLIISMFREVTYISTFDVVQYFYILKICLNLTGKIVQCAKYLGKN